MTAIQEVMKRRSYVTPLVTAGFVGSILQDPPKGRAADQLTSRQREVLQLIAEGRSMKEIAAILNVTPEPWPSTSIR